MRTPRDRAKLVAEVNTTSPMELQHDGYLEAIAAAAYVGYRPDQVRVFYKFVKRHRVEKHYRGRRLLFRRSELERAIGRCTDVQQGERQRDQLRERFDRMERLALEHAQ